MIFRTLTGNWIGRGTYRYLERHITAIGDHVDVHSENPNPTSGLYRNKTSPKNSHARETHSINDDQREKLGWCSANIR